MLDQFKDLFGRFQNLNLINLKIDLESHLVSMGMWAYKDLGDIHMCPMAHGVDCSINRREVVDDKYKREAVWKSKGWPVSDIYDFAFWWDGKSYLGGDYKERQEQLTQLINSMWQERLDDANTVQEILEQEPLVEELPCSSNVLIPLVNQ